MCCSVTPRAKHLDLGLPHNHHSPPAPYPQPQKPTRPPPPMAATNRHSEVMGVRMWSWWEGFHRRYVHLPYTILHSKFETSKFSQCCILISDPEIISAPSSTRTHRARVFPECPPFIGLRPRPGYSLRIQWRSVVGFRKPPKGGVVRQNEGRPCFWEQSSVVKFGGDAADGP